MRSMGWLSLVLVAISVRADAQNTPPTFQAPPSTLIEKANEAVNLEGLIRLDVQVTDDAGHPVAGLQRADFTVLDNGKPQPIVAFQASSHFSVVPCAQPQAIDPFHPSGYNSQTGCGSLGVDLLIDTLDLAPDIASFERSQAVAFLRQNGGRLEYPVTVYSLNDSGFFLTAKSSFDGNALAHAVDSQADSQALFIPRSLSSSSAYRSSFRPTPVDATFMTFPPLTGLRALGAIATEEVRLPGRKILLWVGPGLNAKGTGAYLDPANYYRGAGGPGYPSLDFATDKFRHDFFAKIFWFSALLRQAQLTIDVFSVGEREFGFSYAQNSALSPSGSGDNWTLASSAWKKFLPGVPSAKEAGVMNLYKKVLAVESGGRVLPGDHDLVQQMNDCLRGAATYYTLTFDPPRAAGDDEYHSLEVKTAGPGATAKTTTGYYDEPYFDDALAAGAVDARQDAADDAPQSVSQAITIAQLQQLLQQNGGKVGPVSLRERLPDATLDALLRSAHGGKERDALELAADEAEFLAPPPGEVIADPPPSAAAQKQMLAAAVDYLKHIIPRLPDFFAFRQRVRYGEVPAFHEPGAIEAQRTATAIGEPFAENNVAARAVKAVPLHVEERSTAAVLYRQGQEILRKNGRETRGDQSPIFTYGTFGPVLHTVQAALANPQSLYWGRWEKSGAQRLAVFRLAVPAEQSQFQLTGCCLIDANAGGGYRIEPPYYGELTIDPDSGAIFRFALETTLGGFVPADRSKVMVAYGPVEMNGRTWIVPLRSVSLVRRRSEKSLGEWDQSFAVWGPYETLIDQFTFERYHMFQGSARVLPGFTSEP